MQGPFFFASQMRRVGIFGCGRRRYTRMQMTGWLRATRDHYVVVWTAETKLITV